MSNGLGAPYQPQRVYDRDRPFQDPIERWLQSAMRNTPERFRPEALRFTPTLTIAENAAASSSADIALAQPATVTIPSDQFFILKKLRGWLEAGLQLPGTGGPPITAQPALITPNPAELAIIEFNIRQEGAQRDIFTTPIPLNVTTGVAGRDQDELNFDDAHYTFIPGDTVRVNFTLSTGAFPLTLTNFTDNAAAAGAARPGIVRFGIVLVGVTAHRSIYEQFKAEELKRQTPSA